MENFEGVAMRTFSLGPYPWSPTIFMVAISMGPYLWFTPVLCTPAESTQDYGYWTGSSLVAYRTATCHMGSVLTE
jgi:hypothetical protein